MKEVKLHCESDTEVYPVCERMPIMATKNLKAMNIFNTMEFKIRQIMCEDNKYFFMINNERFTEKEFSECFISSFCLTVYKYQGGEVDSDFNIYDVNRMDKKQIYTAMSRTTRFKHIHLDENM